MNTSNTTINDLERSRETWKQKAAKVKNRVAELERENGKLIQLVERGKAEIEELKDKKKRNK